MASDSAAQAIQDQPKARVFISYSRKDMDFADRLDAALKARGYNTLIDRSDILAFEEWWKRVQALIISADTIIFVLSPDAVKAGTVALKEVAFAASLNKRFAPIVFRRVEDELVPEELAKFNFIFFDVADRFEPSADELAKALNTDIAWIRQHTEFGEQARRWALAGRPYGLLLRSPALEQGERWIASRPNDAPAPTEETRAFILESRRMATRRRNLLTAGLGVGFAVALALAGLAYWQRNAALESQSLFLSKLSLDNVAAGDSTTGLLLALAGLPTWPSGYDRPTIPEALRSLNDSLFSLRESRVFAGHTADVNNVAFDPAGSMLLTSSDDHTARLWNARTGELRYNLAGHQDKVSQAIFSPDGHLVATASDDSTAKIWDSGTGALLQTLSGHSAPITRVAFAKNGSRLVTSSLDGTARIWSLSGNHPATVLRGHAGPLNSAVFSPDGGFVLTTSNDQTAAIWDADSGSLIVRLNGHTDSVTGGEFNAEGSLIVTFSHDNTARIWDVRSGKELRRLKHNDWLRSATFCPVRNCVVTSSDDKTVRVWDLESEAAETVLSHADAVRKAVINPKGNMIATASRDGSLTIWGATTGLDFKKVLFMSGHEAALLDIIFDPTDEFLATAARDHNAITGAHDATARIWRISGPTSASAVIRQAGPIRSSAVAPDGLSTASGLENGTLLLWDTRTQAKIAEVSAHETRINSIAFSRDGTRIITASKDGTAAIWQVPGLSLQRRLPRRSDAISDASLDRDGKRAIVGSYDGSVTIWNVATGESRELAHYPSEIIAAKFSPESNIAIVIALNETAKLYDVDSGQIVRELGEQRGVIQHAAFSAENERAITSGEDGSVIIWNSRTGEKLDQFKLDNSAVFSDLSSSEEYLVTASGKKIIVWRRGDPAPSAIYDGHLDLVTSVHFIPHSQRILSASLDASLQVWDLKTRYSELLGFARSLARRCLSGEQLKRLGVPSTANSWCNGKQLQGTHD